MSDEYPDTNGNGVPDAFENRPSISEILQEAGLPILVPDDGPPTITLELEIAKRPPDKGEMYLDVLDGTVRVEYYSGGMAELIVKRVLKAPPYWKPTKS